MHHHCGCLLAPATKHLTPVEAPRLMASSQRSGSASLRPCSTHMMGWDAADYLANHTLGHDSIARDLTAGLIWQETSLRLW
jgi:hypothetical protein